MNGDSRVASLNTGLNAVELPGPALTGLLGQSDTTGVTTDPPTTVESDCKSRGRGYTAVPTLRRVPS